MLVSFRLNNFRSFADEQELSLLASEDNTREDLLANRDGLRVVPGAAIYGANASGKSNLLTALAVARSLVVDSATELNVGDRIPGIAPFRLRPQTTSKPSGFELTILLGETRYQYGFSADRRRIHSEWLFVTRPGGRKALRYMRDAASGGPSTKWTFRGIPKSDADLLREKTRDNCLLLSRAAELNFDFAQPLYLWFKTGFWYFDLSDNPVRLMMSTAERARDDPTFRKNLENLLRDADLGISGVRIEDMEIPDDGPEDLMMVLEVLKKRVGDQMLPQLKIDLLHRDSEGDSIAFSLQFDESNGTRRLFSLAGPILDALVIGATVVVDELDCSLHPHLTRKLVSLFNNPFVNRLGAQLVFATHDTSLQDSSLLRRDQIWISEKNTLGETSLFSLYDIKNGGRPRRDEAFEKNYRSGRYGGVPVFGPMLDEGYRHEPNSSQEGNLSR